MNKQAIKKQAIMVAFSFMATYVIGAPATVQAAELRGIAGKCLDVDQGNTQDGASVQIWECNGTAAQQWNYNQRTGEVRGPAGKCLDVDNANTANGTRIQLHQCNGTNAQRWTHAKGELRGIAGKCLDVENAHTEDGTRVQLWECNASNAQNWALLR
ncbi:ricin-type beta-trefoil lectin domain protein [Undibacterium sp. Di27W]|uniref:ricin-type beta-trefoil lectin domain protein n=1 Tax=Undibacterium sp. Di27W TaxID=3413036 RepID=UPI003BF2ADCF